MGQLVIFDGAFDRRSSATPSLTERRFGQRAASTRNQDRVLEQPPHGGCLVCRGLLEAREAAILQQRAWPSRSDGPQGWMRCRVLGAPEQVAQRPAARRLLVGRSLTSQLLDACPP